MYDGREVHGRERRFPCKACPKNKGNFRWADYIAKDLIQSEKQKISDARALVQQEEEERMYRPIKNATVFIERISELTETNPGYPAITAWRKAVEKINSEPEEK